MLDAFLWWSGVFMWAVLAPLLIFLFVCLLVGFVLTFDKDDV